MKMNLTKLIVKLNICSMACNCLASKQLFSLSLATPKKFRDLKNLMIFLAIYLLTLIFTPSFPAEDDFCNGVFIERKLEDAFSCRNSTTAPINLSKKSGK